MKNLGIHLCAGLLLAAGTHNAFAQAESRPAGIRRQFRARHSG
jgi:hypothetical protein